MDTVVKTYREIHSVLADSKVQLITSLTAFLDAHLTSDRYSLLEKKKKLQEQLYLVRDSNDEVSHLSQSTSMHCVYLIFFHCM